MKVESPLRILLLRLSSLGDIVLTQPLIQALRTRYPDARIDLVVRAEYADVMRGVTELTTLIELDLTKQHAMGDLKQMLARSKYTHVLDLHNNFRTRKLRMLFGAKVRAVYKRSFQRWLLVKFKINALKDQPDIIGRYFEVAKMLGLTDTGDAPAFRNNATREEKLVAIAPGSRHWNKRWPEQYFIELIGKLIIEGWRVELFGSAEEKPLTLEIEQNLDSDRVKNYAGNLSIAETMERMSRASLAITNDSGLMHVAAALAIPTIAIFGPTVKEFGFMPRNPNATIIENKGLYCRPCTAIGKDYCPERHFRCMKDIGAEMVYDIAVGVKADLRL